MHDNGHVYKGTYEGWYCPRCADFKAENEIAEGDRCPIHEIPLRASGRRTGSSALSSFQEPLERLYAEQPDFVLPARALQRGAVVHPGGLKDVSLRRAQAHLGRHGAVGPEHVFYVWFDALLNYYTALVATPAPART